jgi:hypothetical protein
MCGCCAKYAPKLIMSDDCAREVSGRPRAGLSGELRRRGTQSVVSVGLVAPWIRRLASSCWPEMHLA